MNWFGSTPKGMLGLGVCFAQKSFKIDSKSNRILGLYAGRHTDVGALRAEIIQN